MGILNAEQFFNEIYPNVVNKEGEIVFELNNISVTINTKDSIGHMLQDWISEWANIRAVAKQIIFLYNVIKNDKKLRNHDKYLTKIYHIF